VLTQVEVDRACPKTVS